MILTATPKYNSLKVIKQVSSLEEKPPYVDHDDDDDDDDDDDGDDLLAILISSVFELIRPFPTNVPLN